MVIRQVRSFMVPVLERALGSHRQRSGIGRSYGSATRDWSVRLGGDYLPYGGWSSIGKSRHVVRVCRYVTGGQWISLR